MATSKNYFSRQNYRFLQPSHAPRALESPSQTFELDESDLYNYPSSYHAPELRKPAAIWTSRKSSSVSPETASSLPVNIPDWSKILKDEYRRGGRGEEKGDYYKEDDDVDGKDCLRVPPHEFLAKQMTKTGMAAASFSVHEGIGRTLKGRDLSRVRNAIWEKIGFQD